METDMDTLREVLRDREYTQLLLYMVFNEEAYWPFTIFQEGEGFAVDPLLAAMGNPEIWRLFLRYRIERNVPLRDLPGFISASLRYEKPLDQLLLDTGHVAALDILSGHVPDNPVTQSMARSRARSAERQIREEGQATVPAPATTESAAVEVEVESATLASAPAQQVDVSGYPAPAPAEPQPIVATVPPPPAAPPESPTLFRAERSTVQGRIAKRIIQASSQLGQSGKEDPDALIAKARHVILDWITSKKVDLPEQALEGKAFEIDLADARHPVSVEVGTGCWVMRFDTHADDPPRRVWRVEIVLSEIEERAWIGISLTVIDPAGVDDVRHLSIPVFIRTLAHDLGLWDGPHPLWTAPIEADTEAQLDDLITLLESPRRSRPLVVVACHDDGTHSIEPSTLATALAGMAHVASVDCEASWALTRRYGKPLSVYSGAVRIYRSGFNPDTDSQTRHPLFLAERWYGKTQSLRDRVKELVLEDSIRSGSDSDAVPSYSVVRQWIAEARIKEARRSANTSADKLLQLADEIERLNVKVRDTDDLMTMAIQEKNSALERAEEREEIARQLRQRVAWLEARVTNLEPQLAGQAALQESDFPDTWEGLDLWVEQRLGGRVRLLPQALKAARNSVYKDIPFVCRVLKMLGDEYQPMRVHGGTEHVERCEALTSTLRVEISHVGEAARMHRTKGNYQVSWNGKRVTLDMHVSGSSSRRQESGFRLYFHYDEDEQIVVVGHLPTHLPNTLS